MKTETSLKVHQFVFLPIALGALLLASVAFGDEPPATVDGPKSCATAGCHDVVDTLKVKHAPVQAGECVLCHEPKGNKHEFAEPIDTPELCTDCHEEMLEGKNLHAEPDCMVCHDPHGAAVRGLLREGSQIATCFICHDEDMLEQGYEHGPAAAGACTLCHDPHSSDEEKLLVEPIRDLCASCHEELVDEMDASLYLHAPVEDGCTTCHNPHSGRGPKMLPGSTAELCNQCHEEVVQMAKNATIKHGPLEEEDSCAICHSPHGANSAPMLRAEQVELCLSCHDEEIPMEDGALQNIQAWMGKNDNWHGPIRTGNCAGCHNPHGGDVFRLLKKEYPKKFYASFDMENYALCFECHEPSLVQDEETTTLTNFRDGSRNLHFLHVNKERRGRTCRACHEVHASSSPRHIRDTVPYGKWDMPIQFEKTATGGSCQPGCHEEQKYDHGVLKNTE